jgi:hypothetical protein
MGGALERDDIIDGLTELVRRVRTSGLSHVSIRIVGGAALRLAYFDRPSTSDIDARIEPVDDILPLVQEIARERNWPVDWLNNDASMFIPEWGAPVEWLPIVDDENVSIAVAPVDALLAMKLLSVPHRPGRDTNDVVNLLALNSIRSVEEAERLFESFYPGDALEPRTIELLDRIYELGLPPVPTRTPPPQLG